jgi:hypothetical protein
VKCSVTSHSHGDTTLRQVSVQPAMSEALS